MIVHPAAVHEINRSATWYAERSKQLGKRFRNAIADTFETIEAEPHSFPQAHDDATMSQAWVIGFPFRIVFFVRERDGEVCVISVHHARRRPGYWRSRRV